MKRTAKLQADRRHVTDTARRHRIEVGATDLQPFHPVTGIDQTRNGERTRRGWALVAGPDTLQIGFGKSGSAFWVFRADEGITWTRGHHQPGSHVLNAMWAAYKLVASNRGAA